MYVSCLKRKNEELKNYDTDCHVFGEPPRKWVRLNMDLNEEMLYESGTLWLEA